MSRRANNSAGRTLVMGHSPRTPHRASRRDGFALLITITLLAFLVLLLVSLASLTRVETQVAANNQQLSQARQNALMALNIAVGQLQKYAGPDQRTTARADLQNDPNNSATTVKTSAHWTGVYGNSLVADYTTSPTTLQDNLIDASKVNGYGASARLLNWLVSGNEKISIGASTGFDPSWGGTGHVGTNGEIVEFPDPSSTSAIPFKPNGVITNLTETTSALASNITIANANNEPKPARLLLGAGSVTSSLAGSSPIDYVVAPAVEITAPANTVPGMGNSTSAIPIGRYAWWVGDEGVKARSNLAPSGTALDDKRKAFTNAPRTAIELMDRSLAGYPLDTNLSKTASGVLVGDIYNLEGEPQRALENNQLALSSTDSTALSNALKRRFHDVTTHSFSVLSDTYAGGLKKDLNRILENASVGPTMHTPLWPAEGDSTFVTKWGHLRDYYTNTAVSGVITPRRPVYNNTTTGTLSVGAYPIITYSALGFSYAARAGAAPSAATGIDLNIYPQIVLWNPYNKRMAAHVYQVGMGFNRKYDAGAMELQVNSPLPATPTVDNWTTKTTFSLRDNVHSAASDALPVRYFRFLVNCPALEPGESRTFTLNSSTNDYTASALTMLEPGFNPANYARYSTGTTFGADFGKEFRTVVTGHLRNGSNGGTNLYLAEPGATPNLTVGAATWDPLNAANTWFQSIQTMDYGSITGNPVNPVDSAQVIEGPSQLTVPSSMTPPSLIWVAMCTFGGTGQGKILNDQFGQNVSYSRWIAQANIRAPYIFRTRFDRNHLAPYYSKITTNDSYWPTWYLEGNDATRVSAGLNMDQDEATGDAVKATLFETRESNQPLFSIGHLQQANISLSGSYPAYPVGNSIADYRLWNTKWISSNSGWSMTNMATRMAYYHDVSWLINRALWDRYYFSGIAATGGTTSENPRMALLSQTASALSADSDKPAANMLITGGFNINSTSEQAWRAVLGGINQLEYNPSTDTTGSKLGVVFSRFLSQKDGTTTEPSGVNAQTNPKVTGTNMGSIWEGYRVFSAEQIAQLARNIVAEVRTRGPFTSLGDFVNRRLIDSEPFLDPPAANNAPYTLKTSLTADQKKRFLVTLKGTLQGAIDATTTTNAPLAYAANNRSGTDSSGSFWRNTRDAGIAAGDSIYLSAPNAFGDLETVVANRGAQRSTSANAPKFLTQGDILASIGASLSARSDTFKVRAYGETVNPATNDITGRAWCEAVVQRLPSYVDEGTAAETDLRTAPSSPAVILNQKFGRKFKIISFRWLSPNEI